MQIIIKHFVVLFHYFYFCQSTGNAPVIIEQPQDIIAELDKPMAIHCRVESSSLDDLDIDWYKNGRLVTTDPNARIIKEFMALHVINTMPQDAGVYYCVAKNSHGQTQSRKARIQFIKLDKDFVVSPTSTTASIGEYVRLRCEPPFGSPKPTVYWTKDNKNLSMSIDGYDLIISSIKESDFGSYRCIASNGFIRQSSVAYLTEFHQPNLLIKPSKSRIDLHRGQSINLECQIDNDQYELEWNYKNKIFRNKTLNISSIEYNQSGIYSCNAHFKNYLFTKDILLAVHEQKPFDDKNTFFSQTNLTMFTGRTQYIDCQLPFDSNKNIKWTIVNQSDKDMIQYDYVDKNRYRLKLNAYNNQIKFILFECNYENHDELSQGFIQVNIEQIPTPPIISYVPNNQTVPIGVETIFSCQSKDESINEWWFQSNNRPFKLIKIENNRKYRIDTNNDLIIRYTEKNDAGLYKCRLINNNHDEIEWISWLNVEDARSNKIFHRVERKNLPSAPSQPIVISINSSSIELNWNIQSSDIIDYLIEYYEINSNNKNFQWTNLSTKNNRTQYTIDDLQANTFYRFMVRARNIYGYGLPSIMSHLIQTKYNQNIENEPLHLYEPIDVQPTSVTIKWNAPEQNQILNYYTLHIIELKNSFERIERIQKSLDTYQINNLRSNVDYSIRLVSMYDGIGHSSNVIFIRTLESLPVSAPTNIIIELLTTTSLSIKWNPPFDNETNGQIIAYKINCLGYNETYSIRLTNISSDAKGLYIKNLIENMEYCISIAARTRIGYGPYSKAKCIQMNSKYLNSNHHGLKYLHDMISQPWFLPVIIVTSIFSTCAFSYVIWLCFNYMKNEKRHRIKFDSSASSSNQSVELPVQKTLSNGNRYDLIKDTSTQLAPNSSTSLWMDTIPNGIRFKCCATTTTSANTHSMNIQKNPINALLLESRQQPNPYATTGIFHQALSSNISAYTDSIQQPVTPSSHLLIDQQQIQIPTPAIHYQPPWFDHQRSSTLQSHSQYNHQHCLHCTNTFDCYTSSALRNTTTLRSPPSQHQNLATKLIMVNNCSISPQQTSTHLMMMNSLGGETMTTSWTSSNNEHNVENVSSSSSNNNNQQGKLMNIENQVSSEGSIFSDSIIHPDDEINTLPLTNFERGPSFLVPNV